MVDLSLVFKIIGILITVGGIVVALAVMQTKQTMNIEFLKKQRKEDLETAEKQRKADIEANDKRFEKVEKRVSNSISNQIKTEKLVGEIGLTLIHISEGIDELKKERNRE